MKNALRVKEMTKQISTQSANVSLNSLNDYKNNNSFKRFCVFCNELNHVIKRIVRTFQITKHALINLKG